MATFAYEAMNSSGQEVKDEIEAASSEEAIAKIRGKGFFPTKVREKAGKKKVNKKKGDDEAAPLTKKRKMPLSRRYVVWETSTTIKGGGSFSSGVLTGHLRTYKSGSGASCFSMT